MTRAPAARGLGLALALAACGAGDRTPTERVFGAPPPGPPDRIAPPSTEIIPGMTIAAAIGHGATADPLVSRWRWRPGLELKVDHAHGVVTQLIGLYPQAEREALQARWGPPTVDDRTWMSAGWVARIDPCVDPTACAVRFTRAPDVTFLGRRPRPPLAFVGLAFDDAPATIRRTLGRDPETPTGFGPITVELDDDRLRSITYSHDALAGESGAAHLQALWGPQARGTWPTSLIWIDRDERWAAEADGERVHFFPLVPWSELLAVRGRYSIVAASQRLLGATATADTGLGVDWPATAVDTDDLTRVRTDDDGTRVTAVEFSFSVEDPAAVAPLVERITRGIGQTPGLAITVHGDTYAIDVDVVRR